MKIEETTKIEEIIVNHPETEIVFRRFGIGCVGCALRRYESLGQGARAHGIDIEKLIKALTDEINKKKLLQ